MARIQCKINRLPAGKRPEITVQLTKRQGFLITLPCLLIIPFFLNKFEDYTVSGNIVSVLTNHFLTFVFLNQLLKPPNLEKWQFVTFQNSLRNAKEPSKLFPTFNNKLNKLINTCTISKLMSKHESKQLEKPWITKGIKKAIKTKDEFFFPPLIGKDINSTKIKCVYYLLFVKIIIIINLFSFICFGFCFLFLRVILFQL